MCSLFNDMDRVNLRLWGEHRESFAGQEMPIGRGDAVGDLRVLTKRVLRPVVIPQGCIWGMSGSPF